MSFYRPQDNYPSVPKEIFDRFYTDPTFDIGDLAEVYYRYGLLRHASVSFMMAGNRERLNQIAEDMIGDTSAAYSPLLHGSGLLVQIYDAAGNHEQLNSLGEALVTSFLDTGGHPTIGDTMYALGMIPEPVEIDLRIVCERKLPYAIPAFRITLNETGLRNIIEISHTLGEEDCEAKAYAALHEVMGIRSIDYQGLIEEGNRKFKQGKLSAAKECYLRTRHFPGFMKLVKNYVDHNKFNIAAKFIEPFDEENLGYTGWLTILLRAFQKGFRELEMAKSMGAVLVDSIGDE